MFLHVNVSTIGNGICTRFKPSMHIVMENCQHICRPDLFRSLLVISCHDSGSSGWRWAARLKSACTDNVHTPKRMKPLTSSQSHLFGKKCVGISWFSVHWLTPVSFYSTNRLFSAQCCPVWGLWWWLDSSLVVILVQFGSLITSDINKIFLKHCCPNVRHIHLTCYLFFFFWLCSCQFILPGQIPSSREN